MIHKLQDFCNIKAGYSFRGQVQEDKNGNFYLLQAKDINIYGDIEYNQCIKISTDDIKHIRPLNKGEIVFTNRGSFKSALFESDNSFITSNALFIINADSSICDNYYLSIWLNSSQCRKQLEKVSFVSTTISTLPRNALNNIEIDLPSLEMQKKISLAYKLNNKRLMLTKRLYTLRKTQLENLMNGEII